MGLRVGFFIHIGGEKNDVAKNDIAYLWARKWFFFTQVNKINNIARNDISHFWAHKWFFFSHR